MNILHSRQVFTRKGPQCAVCSAWKRPCGAHIDHKVTAAQVNASFGFQKYTAMRGMADDVNRGVLRYRRGETAIDRARRVLGLVAA